MELMQLTPAQLRRAADMKERIETLQSELEPVLGAPILGGRSGGKTHWTQTPAGRAKLARSIRKSWRTRGRLVSAKLHWTQIPAGRAKVAARMRKTWRLRRAGR